jgi:hypothetical protein
MGAWRVAAEGSWWSSATRTGSCLSADACRCCAGTYSNATGATNATTCVTCGAGESRMPQAPHVMPTLTHTHVSIASLYLSIYLSINLCAVPMSVDAANAAVTSLLSFPTCFTPYPLEIPNLYFFIPASYIICV